jgi:hypothetical protein
MLIEFEDLETLEQLLNANINKEKLTCNYLDVNLACKNGVTPLLYAMK